MSRNQRGQQQDLGRLIRVTKNGKDPPHHYAPPLSAEAMKLIINIQKPRQCLTKFRSRNSWEPSICAIVATPWSPTWECLETLCTGTSAPGSWEWDLCHHTVKDMERETLSQRFTECAPHICSITTYFHSQNVCFAFKCHFKRRSLFSAFTLSFTVLTLSRTRPHVLINQVKGHATLSSLQDAVNDLLLQPRKMCHFLNVQTISGSDFSY